MNIPLGTQELAGKNLSEELVRDMVSFMDSGKTGYFCITTEGSNGIEDALLVIESGNLAGAHYAYLAMGTEHFAGEALKRALNSFHAGSGVYDSYTLSSQQLELLKIFNENMLLLDRIPLRSFEGMIPVSFSDAFEKQELSSGPEERSDIFKRHGLTEIKIDDHSEIKSQVESAIKRSTAPEKVAGEMDSYLGTGEKAPPEAERAQPKNEQKPAEPEQEPGDEELKKLNAQAEKLKKLLLKER